MEVVFVMLVACFIAGLLVTRGGGKTMLALALIVGSLALRLIFPLDTSQEVTVATIGSPVCVFLGVLIAFMRKKSRPKGKSSGGQQAKKR